LQKGSMERRLNEKKRLTPNEKKKRPGPNVGVDFYGRKRGTAQPMTHCGKDGKNVQASYQKKTTRREGGWDTVRVANWGEIKNLRCTEKSSKTTPTHPDLTIGGSRVWGHEVQANRRRAIKRRKSQRREVKTLRARKRHVQPNEPEEGSGLF